MPGDIVHVRIVSGDALDQPKGKQPFGQIVVPVRSEGGRLCHVFSIFVKRANGETKADHVTGRDGEALVRARSYAIEQAQAGAPGDVVEVRAGTRRQIGEIVVRFEVVSP